MAAFKIGPALATGNMTVLKVRSGFLRLTRSFSLRWIFDDLPAIGDRASHCTETRRPYQRSWFSAWCRRHRKRLWYKHSLRYSLRFLLIPFCSFLNERLYRRASYQRTPAYWEGHLYWMHSHRSQNMESRPGVQFEGRIIGIRRKESLCGIRRYWPWSSCQMGFLWDLVCLSACIF